MSPDLGQIIEYLARRRAEGKIIHLSPYTAGKIEEALRAYAYPPPAKVDYLSELESSLPDQSLFLNVFDRLSSDSLSLVSLQRIAKEFAGASARSRASALKKIWSRHQALLSTQAKARATGGRSAG